MNAESVGVSKGWKKAAGIVVLFLLGAAIGGAASYLVFSSGSSSKAAVSLPLAYKLSILLWLPLVVLVPIAVHELGHVVAGVLQKFEFRSYTVAFFHFYMEDGKLKFKWLRKIKGFAGLARCLPRGGQSREKLSKQFALYAFGGPAASLLLALILLAPYYLFWNDITKATPLPYVLATCASTIGLASLLVFVVTIVPVESKGFQTDGRRILNMLRGGNEAFQDSAILSIITASASGTPPGQLDQQLLEDAVSLPGNSIYKVYCHYYLYLIQLQKGNTTQAKQHLEQFAAGLEFIPDIVHASVWLELAYFEARYCRDVELAKAHYSKAKPSAFVEKALFLRAAAAIALAEGNTARAAEKASEAILELKESDDRGAALAHKAWLEAIIEEAQNNSFTGKGHTMEVKPIPVS